MERNVSGLLKACCGCLYTNNEVSINVCMFLKIFFVFASIKVGVGRRDILTRWTIYVSRAPIDIARDSSGNYKLRTMSDNEILCHG
jgi:hypothetical protein